MRLKSGLLLLTFLFFQSLFCENYNNYLSDQDVDQIQQAFEHMRISIPNNPTPMEIEWSSDFNNYEKCVFDVAEVRYDKDDDVIMREVWFQKKLLEWVTLFNKVKKKENKDKLFNWLSENLRLIKKYDLSEWFLVQLKNNRQEDICKMVSFYCKFFSKEG